MDKKEIKEILCQQLQLLTEDAKKNISTEALCNLTGTMINLSSFILSLKD